MQYTLRNIPPALDTALRERARMENKSINQVALEALARGSGFSGEVLRHRDLSSLAGTWKDDPEFDRAVAEQDVIDEATWR